MAMKVKKSKPMKRRLYNMDKIGKVIAFEDMNPEYMDTQVNGLLMELKKPKQYQHQSYIDEKLRNISRFFNTTFDNFKGRIKHPEISKEFVKFMKIKKKEY